MRRLLIAACALLALYSIARAEYRETYYLHGFARTGPFITNPGDTIPAGTTFTSRWLPISGAQQVNFFMRTSSADSDSVVRVYFQSSDTVTAIASLTAANIDTAVAETGNLGLGTAVYSNYTGSGGVGWGPEQRRTITIVPFQSTTVKIPYIPQRWVRFVVIAPNAGTVAVNSWNSKALNTMHGVRMWVEVVRDEAPKGADPLYPFNGTSP